MINKVRPQLLSLLPHIERCEIKTLGGVETLIITQAVDLTRNTLQLSKQNGQWFLIHLVLREINSLLLRSLKISSHLPDISQLIEVLKKAPQLEVLEIDHWPVEDLSNLLNTLGNYCPNLHTLRISKLHHVKEIDLSLLRRCSKLRVLSLSNSGAKFRGVDVFLEGAERNLKQLTLFNCNKVTGEILHKKKFCPQLRSLNLGQCPFIELKDLIGLPFLSKLEHLSISGLNIPLGSLSFPSLKSLNVSKSSLVTGKYLENLLKNTPNLTSIDARKCPLTRDEVNSLRLRFPLTKIFHELCLDLFT